MLAVEPSLDAGFAVYVIAWQFYRSPRKLVTDRTKILSSKLSGNGGRKKLLSCGQHGALSVRFLGGVNEKDHENGRPQ